MASPLIEVKVNDTRFSSYLLLKARAFRRTREALTEGNRRSLQWITERSVQNLRNHIAATGRAPDPRHGRLAALMRNPAVSSYDSTGFRFMIHARVDVVNARIAAYYRVIEGPIDSDIGSDYWVRRTSFQTLGLLFAGPSGPGGQAVYRASWNNFRLPRVHIRQPIMAYHYARDAREAFIQSHLYGRWMNEELARVGIDSRLRRR